ncbi:MAG: hypothetical protein HQ504_11920, partial [Rhodospirillaceae bacterium]|nr:hypothetical protein [Rhodospirillaceae bacterium]
MNGIYSRPMPSRRDIMAYNHWQLEEEKIGRDRRIALRANRSLPKGWWKQPMKWMVVIGVVFMAREAFASLLVDLLVRVG